MKDVEATMRRIDAEIMQHHQRIAAHRVEIARLQEARLTLMNIAEADIAAAEEAKAERTHALNGHHAKPMLIVRKEVKTADEVREEARREVEQAPKPAKKGKRGGKRERNGVAPALRPRILETLKGDAHGLTTTEIGNYLGIPRGDETRKPLHNAIYYLNKTRQIVRNEAGRYTLRN